MKRNELPTLCPRCGKSYSDPPALSRKDNQTLICPECGVREALIAIALPDEEIDRILNKIKDLRSE